MRNIVETGVGARLNLGCGDDIQQGYLNIDIRKTHPNVIQVDLSKLPWPFADSSAEEILMLDFLEHFPYKMTVPILLECRRVLQDNGTVVIQVPDAYHLSLVISDSGPYLCNRCGASMHDAETSLEMMGFVSHEECPGCKQPREDIEDAAMMRMYGGQDHEGNYHYTCFNHGMLCRKAYQAGLSLIQIMDHEHQYKNWNMKLRFGKGSVW